MKNPITKTDGNGVEFEIEDPDAYLCGKSRKPHKKHASNYTRPKKRKKR